MASKVKWSARIRNFSNDSMNLSGDKVPIRRGELPQGELSYWPMNPRIFSIVHAADEELDQVEIQLELQAREHVKDLIHDIKYHGGLVDPIVVIDGSYHVIEGNSRLAAIRFLIQSDLKKYGKVPCVVLPADISEKKIYSYLNQEHIKGKSQWSPYEQAGVIYRLVGKGLDFKTLAEELNIGARKAQSMYETYKFMVENDEDKPSRYSYYQVFLTNRQAKKIRETDPRVDNRVVKEVRQGQVTAQQFRDMLPAVCGNKKELNRFLSGKTSLLGSYEKLDEMGKLEDVVKNLKRVLEKARNLEKKDFDALNAKAQKDAEFYLSKIISTLSTLKRNVYGKK